MSVAIPERRAAIGQEQELSDEDQDFLRYAFDYALEHKQMDDSYVEDFERFLNNWSDNTITNTKLLKSIFKDIPWIF